jgi:hypothetical protein
MDDDDWYGPRFLDTLLAALTASQQLVCRPTIAFLRPFLFFHLARWEIRRSEPFNVPGATLLFAREDWQACPFRPLPGDEDFWFLHDQTRQGVEPLPVDSLETFLAVRHASSPVDRGHTWTHQADGRTLEQYLGGLPRHRRRPEQLLPAWALSAYRTLRDSGARVPGRETVP